MRRNPIVVGAAVVAGLLLFVLFVVVPKNGEADALRDDIAVEQQHLADLEADVAELESAQATGATAAELAAIRQAVPTEPDLAGLLASLRAAATEAGVGLSSIAPGVPASATSGSASAIPLSLVVSGEYFALARFLFELENLPRLARVSAISISAGDAGAAGNVLSMQVTAEVYTTDLSTGPGSDPAPGAELGA